VTRALSPVVGVVLLAAITVVLAASVGLVVSGSATADPPPQATFSLSADATTDRIALTHEGGDTLSTTDLTVRITVDGEPLEHQPPVPFFAATGFRGGPTGPFNPATDPEWTAGEPAAVRLASTNAPLPGPGSTVAVTISTDGAVIAELETQAE
jgi:flagellin-like protein